MPVIKINGQQFALQPGQNRLGGGTTADVAVGNLQGVQAIVDLGADGRATIRKTGGESIRVNGTDLAQPTPLIHGDKVEIAGTELFFADDVKQGGSTQFVSAADVASIAAKRSGPARGTLSSGGRLVSLVDGKEYAIPDAGIIIGRDASADIVVAQTAVSRRHAQVIAGANGYIINDLSTNGVFVNGEKAVSGHALSRADVIRVGTEEFRFYADLAKPGAAPGAAPAAAAPARPAAPPAPAAPAAPAKPVSPPTPPARPATPPPAPAASAEATVKVSTLPNRTVPPSAPPPPPQKGTAPITTKKGIPTWAALLVIVAVAAVAAYFIMALKAN